MISVKKLCIKKQTLIKKLCINILAKPTSCFNKIFVKAVQARHFVQPIVNRFAFQSKRKTKWGSLVVLSRFYSRIIRIPRII